MDEKALIIVIRYGEPGDACLSAVREHTDLDRHELLVFDNTEPDCNLGTLWNRLIRESRHCWICLLNSDAEPCRAGWLDDLLRGAIQCRAGLAGPVTNKCGIRQQVAGEPSSQPDYRKTSVLSGFCLLFSREVWDAAGGFREDFPFYGQDSNFTDRAGKIADMVICRHVFVRHEGNASFRAAKKRSHRREKEVARQVYLRNRAFDWSQRLLIVGSGEVNTCQPLFRGIEQAAREFMREGMPIRLRGADMSTWEWEECRHWEPDLTVVVNTNPGRLAQCAAALKDFPGRKGLWFNDLRGPAQYEALAGVFDRLSLCWSGPDSAGAYDPGEWQRLLKTPVDYMPQGSFLNPQLGRHDKIREVIFIGGTSERCIFHEDRKAVCERLGAEVVNHRARSRRISVERRAPLLYRQSRYCLSISPTVEGYTSLRLYNILACGGLALARRFPGCERLFSHGEHLLWWETPEEAKRLIRQWRKRDRESVSRAGWRLQQARHNVGWRLLNIADNLIKDRGDFWR